MDAAKQTTDDNFEYPTKYNPRNGRGKVITTFEPIKGKDGAIGFEHNKIRTNKTLRRNFIMNCETFYYDAYDNVFSTPIENSYSSLSSEMGRIKKPKYMVRNLRGSYCVHCNSHMCSALMDQEKPRSKKSLKKLKNASCPSRHDEKELVRGEIIGMREEEFM
jgi:hypothetical protein